MKGTQRQQLRKESRLKTEVRPDYNRQKPGEFRLGAVRGWQHGLGTLPTMATHMRATPSLYIPHYSGVWGCLPGVSGTSVPQRPWRQKDKRSVEHRVKAMEGRWQS